jgi:hypothetical protein
LQQAVEKARRAIQAKLQSELDLLRQLEVAKAEAEHIVSDQVHHINMTKNGPLDCVSKLALFFPGLDISSFIRFMWNWKRKSWRLYVSTRQMTVVDASRRRPK